ncbi:MAG: integrase arm-type DNA-binding domain-containing protein [Burkholderiales bacterium]
MPLTDTKIRNAKPGDRPVKLTDAGGLYLQVQPSGSKLWRYRYRIAGKENVYALGEYAKEPPSESADDKQERIKQGRLTLAEARTERDKCRGLVKQGVHPAHNRQARLASQIAENANTFEAVALEWIEKKKSTWSGYYLRQVERFLKADVLPYIGSLPVRSVTAAHLLEIVRRIEKRGAVTVALLVRQWCSAIFCYAVATLRADADPAAALKGAIQPQKVKHRKPLSRAQIPGFAKALEEFGGYRTTAIALRLLMLTFVRPVELRGAEWTEFDFDHAEWRIPAERMKMGEEHIVPLSTQAVELLRELKTLTGGQRWLFPNYRRPKTFMTSTTLNRALERMGYAGQLSSHGFRATASTILNETGFLPDVIERQLAHKERNKTRASYNQAEYLDDRRKMMQQWANMVGALAAGKKVVPLRKDRAA